MNYEQIDLQIAERQAQKGFGKKHAEPPKFAMFQAEIKTRMRDNSELLLGTATLRVPAMKDRSVEKAIAISATTYYLLEKAPKNANQIFLFTHTGRFVDRIELQEWDDGDCQKTALEDREQSLLAIAYETCQIEVNLLPRPIVA
ncbi:MAG TPA: hypothetical protein DD990_32680 [Cyanobacteria bacterium UBA11368]|nr:hypothetical protein [Cyanobacteria bacterium UBA11368]